MNPALLILLLSTPLQAGVLKGIVVENQTSFPLARARVSIDLIEGDHVRALGATVATRSGQFTFDGLPEGSYRIKATRAGFAEAHFGQRRFNAPGIPVFIAANGEHFAEIRLKRLAVITGRVLDENRVGLPGVPVVAYTTTNPMTLITTATTDERGVYRLTRLVPGRYFVRTAASQLEEGLNLVPTYHPFTATQLRDAQQVTATLDEETTNIDVQPAQGNLAGLGVRVSGCLGPAKITLSSDTGRQQANAVCGGDPISFNALSPGDYEILAEGDSNRGKLAAFQQVQLYGSRVIELFMRPLPEIRLKKTVPVNIFARRADLAGPSAEIIPITADHIQLAPGFWQLTALPGPGSYLAGIAMDAAGNRRQPRDGHPDWFQAYLEYPTQATVDISARAARLTGKAPASAPVYLLPITPQTRRQMNGPRITQADTTGMYHFESLAPGQYLVLSTYDIAEITEEAMTAAQAKPVTIEEGNPAILDLK